MTCHPVAPAATATTTAIAAAPSPAEPAEAPPSQSTPPTALAPIVVGADGSLDRDSAAALIDPVRPGTSTLRAHVWFLYRLAGLGDWNTFIAAYRDAGLHDDDSDAGAPLRQVQALNTVGADMERYRLTAAALAAAGEYTGRLSDPYPDYRDLVATELVSSCLGDSTDVGVRMTLPPPSITPAAPVTSPAPGTVGEVPVAGGE